MTKLQNQAIKYLQGIDTDNNIFTIMEAEAKKNTVYNCIHIGMVDAYLEDFRALDIMEIEREEVK
jgi:hypothetical protein